MNKIISILITIITAGFLLAPGFARATDISACQTISSAGTYVLQNDVTSNATCFAIGANDVTLDLGGHTVTYDNTPPISVVNGSFESSDMSSWDLSGASMTVRSAGAYLDRTVYDGNYALKIPAPMTSDQVITTSGSYALSANMAYSASVMMWQPYDVTNAANSDIHMSIEILNAVDDSVLSAADSRSVQSQYTTRGLQYVHTVYTPTNATNVKIRLKVTGARTVTNSGTTPYGAFYLDDVRIQQTASYGIQSGVVTMNGGWAKRVTIKNGTIIQGQAHGDFSHAINVAGVLPQDVLSAEVANLNITVSGNSTKAVSASFINSGSIHDLHISSAVDTIEVRDHYDGALIHVANGSAVGTAGAIYNNVIDSGIQTGIFVNRPLSAATRPNIYNNNITLQSKYTNDFAIAVYGGYGANVYGNTINCGNGFNSCRGVHLEGSDGGTVNNNIIGVHYLPNNQEYSGCGGWAYGIQIEGSINTEVYSNTVTANADQCGAIAFRYYGPDSTAPQNNSVHDNIFNALAVSGSSSIASVIGVIQSFSQALSFTRNVLTTNSNWLQLGLGVTTSLDRSFTMDNNTYQLSYPKAISYYPLTDQAYAYAPGDYAARNVTLSNNIYGDATVRNDISTAQFRTYYSSYGIDQYAFNIVITEASSGDTAPPSSPTGLGVM
ncbi:MAG: periplasmic copper-binding protein [Candidatus Moranbacteria bacterium GW2011_GWE1_35_17]|nr:MAG: periplasmic copper-binding protein [Candidatus Moranbacteria bacterium GW2011_GWE1_35_17]KKP83908.1 MAG: periplasmic copper-binding protein [Candidatus Moranbacteria bacterium GW2011_GWF1_35_5]KKP84691.1 MAG: periplasmic copper-binding protein [Candidatus Moranbacteria bacterium GW2011_GWF2_35_54]